MKNIEINLSFLNKVSTKEKAFFARQLATMLESGLSMDKALKVLANQTKNPKFKKSIEGVLASVEAGEPLSSAFKKDPEVFDPIFVNIVLSGEAVGKLSETLKKLADNIERQESFISKIKGALYYPLFILIVMLVIVWIMLVYVIPPLKEIFADFGSDLPWTTRMLLSISDFVTTYWWIVLLIIIFIGISVYYYLQTKNGKYAFAKYEIKAPTGIGKLIYMQRFCTTLSMLLHSGTPIIKTLNITAEVMNNVIYRDSLNKVAEQMKRGVPLSTMIEKDSNFDQFISQMIRVGEETGKVDQTLENLAQYYGEQVDKILKNINSLIEPVLIVVIAIGVAFIVFSIIMPIYQLVQIQ